MVVLIGLSALAAEPPGAVTPGGTQKRDIQQLAMRSQVAALMQRIKRDCGVFQLGIEAPGEDLGPVTLSFNDLRTTGSQSLRLGKNPSSIRHHL